MNAEFIIRNNEKILDLFKPVRDKTLKIRVDIFVRGDYFVVYNHKTSKMMEKFTSKDKLFKNYENFKLSIFSRFIDKIMNYLYLRIGCEL